MEGASRWATPARASQRVATTRSGAVESAPTRPAAARIVARRSSVTATARVLA